MAAGNEAKAHIAICLIDSAITLLEAAEREGPRGEEALPGVINPIIKKLRSVNCGLVSVKDCTILIRCDKCKRDHVRGRQCPRCSGLGERDE